MPLICTRCEMSLKGARSFIQISRRAYARPYIRTIEQSPHGGLYPSLWEEASQQHRVLDEVQDGIYCTVCQSTVDEDSITDEERSIVSDNRIETWRPDAFPADTIVDQLKEVANRTGAEIYHRRDESCSALYGNLDAPLLPSVAQRLQRRGIQRLYCHQTEAINAIRERRNVVTVTSTASGKTLIYMIPAIEELLQSDESTVLYLSPLKALMHDQLLSLGKWSDLDVDQPGIDGFSYVKLGSRQFGAGILEHGEANALKDLTYQKARYWLTSVYFIHPLLQWATAPNRNMAHLQRFFTNLKYVVLDELHSYTGVLGSKVSMLLRRIRMLCRMLGNNELQFIACSASIGNPLELAEDLTGLKGQRGFLLVEKDGSPSSTRDYFLWNPGLLDNQTKSRSRRAPVTDVIEIFRSLATANSYLPRAIVFYGFRRGATQMSFDLNATLKSRLFELNRLTTSSSASHLFASFNGKLTAEKKAELMNQLKNGDVVGVVSTQALEMGIDIGELSLCIMIGYAGSKAAFLQQAGRVGRSGPGVVIQIFQEEPLEQYYSAHPDEFFERDPEHVAIDYANYRIIGEHLNYAANEQGGELNVPQNYFKPSVVRKVMSGSSEWIQDGPVTRLNTEKVDYAPLLSFGKTYRVVYKQGQRMEPLLQGLDDRSVIRDYFINAVFRHDDGRLFKVNRITNNGDIYVSLSHLDYETRSYVSNTVQISEEDGREPVAGSIDVVTGRVEVVRRMWGYKKVRMNSGEQDPQTYESSMWPVRFSTDALWIEFPKVFLGTAMEGGDMGETLTFGSLDAALHVTEHVVAAAIPMVIKCAYGDFQSMSITSFDGGAPAIVLYEAAGGGAGIVDAIRERLPHVLRKAYSILTTCACEHGCPNCTHLSQCERENTPLNKADGIRMLRYLIEHFEDD